MNRHWIPVILLMGIIFYLSHQPASQSNSMSTSITERLVVAIEKISPSKEINTENFNHIIRKSAHFFVYLLLGLLVLNALIKSGVRGYRSMLLALLICIIYAASDEIHQLFIPGRGGQLRDVILDSSGSTVGIISFAAFKNWKYKST